MINSSIRMPFSHARTRLSDSPRAHRKYHRHSGAALKKLQESGVCAKKILTGVSSAQGNTVCLAEFADDFSHTLWQALQAEHLLENNGKNALLVSSFPGVWYPIHLLCTGTLQLLNASTRQKTRNALQESAGSGNFLQNSSLPIRPLERSPETPVTACALWREQVYGKTEEDKPDRSSTAMGIAVSGTPGLFASFEHQESPLSFLPDNAGLNRRVQQFVNEWAVLIFNRGPLRDLPEAKKSQLYNRLIQLCALGAQATCGNVYIASMPLMRAKGDSLLADHILKPCNPYGVPLDENSNPHIERLIVRNRRTTDSPHRHTQERLLSCRQINDPVLAEDHDYKMVNASDPGVVATLAKKHPEIKPLNLDESPLSRVLSRSKILRPSEKELRNAQIHEDIRRGIEKILLDMKF